MAKRLPRKMTENQKEGEDMYEDEAGTIVPADVITEVYDLEKEWKRKHED